MVDTTGHGRVTHSSGALVYLQVRVFASIAKVDTEGQPTAAHVEHVHGWLRAHGHGDIIKQSVHPQTFNALMKQLVEDGVPLPEGVKTSVETVAVIRKPKGE
jgi:hypothetical protein